MKTGTSILLAAVATLSLILPTAARADVRKEQVYILGIHLGNANGTLYGLRTSYDTSKRAHPVGVPLLHRQFRWSIDLAKALNLPTADLEALDRDLEKLEFSDMNKRLQPILLSYRAALAKEYVPQATSVFNLGLELTMAGGAVRRALNDLPDRREPFRKLTVTLANAMVTNITTNKLEATVSLASDLSKRAGGGTDFNSLETFIGQILKRWQEDFRNAPGWSTAGGGVVVANFRGSLTTVNSKDRERKASYSTVHSATLRSGATYVIDLESGNGRAGSPGYFDVWLRIEDAAGRTLLNNDDGGEGFNARATFRPTVSGTYRLVVTTYYSGATGNYTLTVRQK